MRNSVVKAYAVGFVSGAALVLGVGGILAPTAKADEYTGAERLVCSMIDFDPTIPGVTHTAGVLVAEAGVTAYQAGQIIAQSVMDQCPEHLPLLKRYVDYYEGGSANTKVGGKVA